MSFKPLFLACLLFVPGLPALAGVPTTVPAESFLDTHVSTLGALSQEVTVDPIVRGRLARHFHVSESQMVTYIHRNLVLTSLKTAGTYRVACVRPDGLEYWVQSRLPAGTPIFAARTTGRPVLKLACGNPMTASLPAVPAPAALAPPRMADLPRDLQMAAVAGPALLPADLDAVQVASLVDTPALTDVPVVLTSPSFETLLPSASRVTNLLPALLGAAGTVATIGGLQSHHNGSTSSGGAPKPGGGGGPAPVPEASTSLLMAAMLSLGGGFLLARRKRTA